MPTLYPGHLIVISLFLPEENFPQFLFAQGKDMHAETARAMFGLSADIDTREHLYKGVAVRDIAKTINFGLVYGMGVQGLANRIGVSKEEVQKLIGR